MIRYAHSGDVKQIRDLWDICFPDESGFNEYFFSNLFVLENVLLYLVDDQIAAMTQMIPCKIRFSDRVEDCTYIYGACTHPEYRRQHLMSRLLERSFVLDQSLGRKCSVLIPAEPWLFDFYHDFGYRPVFKIHTTETVFQPNRSIRLSMLSEKDIPAIDTLYEEQFSACMPHLARDRFEWDKQIKMFRKIGLGCMGLRDSSDRLLAYAFAWKPENESVYVQEIVAGSENTKQMLLNAVSDFADVSIIRYSHFAEEPLTEKLGCMKRYDNLDVSIAYMNLMMN